MKKCILFILISSCLSGAYAQMLIMQKPWETNLSVFYGHNYSSGYDLSITINIRINESNWGVYGDFSRTDEKVKIAGENNDFSINGFYPSLGITYSLREKLSPAPFDIVFNGGFTHGSAKLDLADGQQVKENSFGNHLGMSVKYMFTPRFSLCLRQTLHILYDSPFGNTRTTTSAGLSFTF
jgi:hypothetical protein